ncbi:hypothetical protein [Pseudarthrobacter niigatensis]|uniref:Meckel syndrome type 1 protein n=1 Tax=Pseudarthrobacter niigatensis TaxID=369935 RepID=A0AAJ1STR3_9MICC|nr:hypothetical protein [Pseudarthrobacter niigatensis]MDQ0145579.1 hypothetical protein [Pseudarthrobacter niigatensis]MDQ0265433.1 hypothetical protein [Pseudarthrobacter niigatensis]
MEPKLNAWIFLRPLLLAVAAAAAWIALSAAGASADSAAHNDPLLAAAPPAVGGVATAVSQQALDPIPSRTVSKPAPALAAVPPIQPAAKDAAALADHVTETVPVVNTVVPEGTVAAAVDPALGTVDRVVGGTVVPVAGAVLEPLAKPLAPVLDPVLSAVPLPAPVAAGEQPAAATLPPAADAPPPGGGAPAGAAASVAAPTGIAPGSALAGPKLLPLHERLPGNGPPLTLQPVHAAGAPQLPGAEPHNTPMQGPLDAPPGTAAGGSGSTSGNGSGLPAWLAPHTLQIPEAGPSSVQGGSPLAMPPVSFDPGSSPD